MSGKIGIIVQARMSSFRFPGKSLKKIGDKPLIFYVLSRLKLTGLPLFVCTSDQTSDDVLADYLVSHNFLVYRGCLNNVLERYKQSAKEFGIEKIIRVTGDNPLVDINFLMESLPLFNSYNYVDGIYPKGLIKGIGFEFVSYSELLRIPTFSKTHREHVTSWLRENMGNLEKRTQLSPDAERKFRNDIFLTVDYPEDLELLNIIYSHFNFRFDIKTHEVVNFIDKNPRLKEINNRRHFQ